jgi:hypothetical protein
MACTTGIAKAITSNCTTQPVGGLEVVAYLWKRGDMTITYDGTSPNKVTGIAGVGSAVIYKFTGVKKNLNAGHDRTVSDDIADAFKHFLSFKGFESDTLSVLNFDGLGDICAIVEYKQKSATADGVYVGYGLKSGLYPTTDTRRANDANGIRSIEMASRDQEDEPYSQYNVIITDYAGTKAALEALLT